jgi:hypothetical protein
MLAHSPILITGNCDRIYHKRNCKLSRGLGEGECLRVAHSIPILIIRYIIDCRGECFAPTALWYDGIWYDSNAIAKTERFKK